MIQFDYKAGVVTVHDDRFGRYPTLFGPDGRKFVFQDDGSSFNDAEKLWRYLFRGTLSDEDIFVFATAEREVAAEIRGNDVVVTDRVIAVDRAPSGAPLAIVGTPRPRITIMIVTMSRREILEKTLWYLYETSDDTERDIWIWDNASTDDTAAFLGTLVGWPGVRVFRSKVDLGVAGPRKRMLSAVRTPYIFTLDDDVWMINRGWASACVRALDAEASIHQLIVQQGYVHSTNNFGSAHSVLARPFFRMPILSPRDPGPEMAVVQKGWLQPGTDLIQCGGETVLIPAGVPTDANPRADRQLPFAASGGAAAWRTSDILPFVGTQDRHLVCDLREVWGFPLMERNNTREGMIFRYGAFHPCPGPIWHLGLGETYWAEKVRHSEAIYNRAASEQARWLESAREAIGWGCALEDPDEVL